MNMKTVRFEYVSVEKTMEKSETKIGNEMEEGQERSARKGKTQEHQGRAEPKEPREREHPRTPGKGITQGAQGRGKPKNPREGETPKPRNLPESLPLSRTQFLTPGPLPMPPGRRGVEFAARVAPKNK